MSTTVVRRILSTCSITLFEVLLSIIVLQEAQVLRQSSAGMDRRAIVKGESSVSNNSVLNRRVFNPKYRHRNWRKGLCEVGEEGIYGCGVVGGAGAWRV